MARNRAEILIEKMLSNKLNSEELSEFLKSIHDDNEKIYYSEILENYFNKIIEEDKSVISTRN